jgi:peptidoglycan/xylan/chitin deacetylase (PgdA/CDA1 family)
MNRTAILKTSLDMLFYSGASQALRGMFGGMGAIFMLHHIRPGGGLQDGFAPNAGLEITPEFLDAVIGLAQERGYDLLALDEAVNRVKEGRRGRPFVVFTIDDGYRDNLVHAWPIFRKRKCPFTIFVSPAITDGKGMLWWRGLEAAIASDTRITSPFPGQGTFDISTDAEKQNAWEKLYWLVRAMPEAEQRGWIRRICESQGISLEAMCRAEAMTWDELRDIAADPLCAIGAHTTNHYAMAKLPADQALKEAVDSRDRIEQELGKRPNLFAYPYGDESSAGPRDFALMREAGFDAALTTRKGVVYRSHKDHLMGLPRVSLNGGFQKARYVDVMLSGSAFAIWNGFRRLNVA